MEHAVCENLPCARGLPSFRDQQCQAQDRLSSKKKGLLTAVVVDGKGIGCTLVLRSFPGNRNPSEHPEGTPSPRPTQREALVFLPSQPWTYSGAAGLNLDDPALCDFPKQL